MLDAKVAMTADANIGGNVELIKKKLKTARMLQLTAHSKPIVRFDFVESKTFMIIGL
jgi:hypothetical protein